jgi:hypothetical protein
MRRLATVTFFGGLLASFTFGCGSNSAANSAGGHDGGAGSVATAGSGGATGTSGGGGSTGTTGGGGSSGTPGGGGATGTTGGAGTTGTTGAAGGGTTTGGGGSTGTGGASATGGCDPNGPKCNNCKDDDGDGLIDALDPECVGPLDNDESSFATGIPGDNVDACKQDCFFDGNSGQGDDGCDWNFKCDPASPGANAAKACPYDASYHNCTTTQSQKCLTTCRTVTPNGCDCFGCCLVPGAPHPIYLAPACTAANFDDPTKCPACTQQTSCMNTCEHCEICVGKTTLPPDCVIPPPTTGAGGTTGTTGAAGTTGTTGAGGAEGGTPCAGGRQYCGPGGIAPGACPTGTYCTTGCCIPGIG